MIDMPTAGMDGLLNRLPPYARPLLGQWDGARLAEALDAMRPPHEVMTTDVLKRVKASRVSFTRGLVDRMLEEKWRIERRHCEVAGDGRGLVVYDVTTPSHALTFATRCEGLPPIERSGRIKDNELDFYSVLFDGRVGLERIQREGDEQLRKVWKGRTDNSVLGWTFGNRSNRHFEHAVGALARGGQPDLDHLAAGGGYIIRNAGFYGNGRHGCRTWQAFGADHPLAYPYHVDLFTIYLWRLVGFDFAEAIARARNPLAPPIEDHIKRYLGVGNQSGIGMVAALVRWPHWVSGFCFTRELALAVATTEPHPVAPARLETLAVLLRRASRYYRENDRTIDPAVEDRERIASELEMAGSLVEELRSRGTVASIASQRPFSRLMSVARKRLSLGAAEQLASILIDVCHDVSRQLTPLIPAAMGAKRDVIPEMTVAELRAVIRNHYDWALSIDFGKPQARHFFWYRSEENGENRRGERAVDPGSEFETFVDVAGHVQDLDARLAESPPDWTVSRHLLRHPDDVYIVSRIQLARDFPYSEVQSNIICQDFLPSDLIQFYLAVLGMETTDPNNFKWVRGVFFQGAPLPEDIVRGEHRDWLFPVILAREEQADAQPAFDLAATNTDLINGAYGGR